MSYQRFTEQLANYREQLDSYAAFTVRDTEAARDLVSDVYARVLQKKEPPEEDRLLPYLYSSVRNACLNHLRDNSRHGSLSLADKEMEPFYERALAGTDMEQILGGEVLSLSRKCLSGLSGNVQRAWWLSRRKGLSYKEIADEMGVSVKRVDKYLQKAARALRLALKDYL